MKWPNDSDPEANGDKDMTRWGSGYKPPQFPFVEPEDLMAKGRATGRYAQLIDQKRHPDTRGLDETVEHANALLDWAFTVVVWLAVALGFAAFAFWPAFEAWWKR